MLYLKLLPCEGEVARSAETEGFARHFRQTGKKRLGSAENPSVSLRDPPSLGKGRSFLLLTSRLALVYLDMVKTGVLCSG